MGRIYQRLGRIYQRLGRIDARVGRIDAGVVHWNAGRHGQRAQQKQARNEFHVKRCGLCIVRI